jgi:hypothetical protein
LSALCELRDEVRRVLSNTAPDDPLAGPYVNSRQIANHLVQQAITAADPVPAIQTIIQILETSDPA